MLVYVPTKIEEVTHFSHIQVMFIYICYMWVTYVTKITINLLTLIESCLLYL